MIFDAPHLASTSDLAVFLEYVTIHTVTYRDIPIQRGLVNLLEETNVTQSLSVI